jgi:LmbE family N-acetylglucosaminyl deacetylase
MAWRQVGRVAALVVGALVAAGPARAGLGSGGTPRPPVRPAPPVARKAAALKGLHADGVRLLVFAPHPDDADLAAGGLIRRVVRGGGDVWVAFMTSGDGFLPGVAHETNTPHPGPTDFQAYAKRREEEAVEALGSLGVPRDHLLFLGFPDRGLCPILRDHPRDRAPYYRSPYTRADRPPPTEILVRNTEYDAPDLEREVERVLARVRPTLVVVPHWADRHPDHCATWFVVHDALEDVEVPRARPAVAAYLIHADGWPAADARTLRPPPGFPARGQWVRFPLSDAEAAAKRGAITRYRTQMHEMASFLLGFARHDELFVLDAQPVAGARRQCCAG